MDRRCLQAGAAVSLVILAQMPAFAQNPPETPSVAVSERSFTTAEDGSSPALLDTIPVNPPAVDMPTTTESRPASRLDAIQEIVVTAQRREENLQEVPISVTAFSAADIESRDISSFTDVARTTPGFVFGQTFGQVAPTIRGVGADRFTISSEPGVALYVDDIYYGRPYLPQAALTSLERIEVLKGPQGTLYGRNASGGALKLVSKRPGDEFELSAGAQYGRFDQVVVQGSMTVPLADNLSSKVSVVSEDRDGYVENRARNEDVEGHEVRAARAAIAYNPWDWLDVDVNADISRQRDTGPVARAVTPVVFGFSDSIATPAFAPYDRYLRLIEEQFGVVLTPLREALIGQLVGGRVSHDRRIVYQDAPTRTEIDNSGVGVTLAGQFGDIGAKLITGYRDSRRDFIFDGDLTDFPGLAFVDPNFTEAHQFSSEFQVASDFELPWLGGPVHVLAGLFYYSEDAAENINTAALQLGVEQLDLLGALIPPQIIPLFQNTGVTQILFDSTQATRSNAAFADLEWLAAEWLRLHLGGRYTRDRKVVVGTVRVAPGIAAQCEDERQSESFGAGTLRLGADILFDEDRMLYASYSEGFKSGGFNPAVCSSGPYAPEYVAATEIGIKSQWLDGSVQINAAAFRYDYTDIQVEKVVGFATSVVNGPEAKIDGAELAVIAVPFAGLTLDGAVSWIDARYGTFSDDDPFTLADSAEVDLKGNRLNKAPEWSGSLGLTAEHGLGALGDISARVEWSYTGRMFYDYFNHDFAEGPAYEIWNLFINFSDPDTRWGVQVFGKNLTDEFYWAGQVTPSAIVGGPFTFFGLPRTYGVGLSFRF